MPPAEGRFGPFEKLRVKAMGDKLREMVEGGSCDEHALGQKTAMPAGAEDSARRSRKVAELAREAGFKDAAACIGDVVYLPDRTPSKGRIARYAECARVENCEVVAIISKTGCGKSFPTQAIGNAACRKPVPVRYARLAGICDEPDRARTAADGGCFEKIDGHKGAGPLIIDDFMTAPTTTQNSIGLSGIMGAREGRRATVIASQLEPNERCLRIEGEPMADSILNRIATGARFIDLEGPNMRDCFAKRKARSSGTRTACSWYHNSLIDSTSRADCRYHERLLPKASALYRRPLS